MTRIGINPARGVVSDYRPPSVTVAVLTYIPDLSGYFEHRLQVLQMVFASLHAFTTPPHDLMVFDNGSCPPVVDYLRSPECHRLAQKFGGYDFSETGNLVWPV